MLPRRPELSEGRQPDTTHGKELPLQDLSGKDTLQALSMDRCHWQKEVPAWSLCDNSQSHGGQFGGGLIGTD